MSRFRFKTTRNDPLQDFSNHSLYLKNLQEKLNIKHLDEWYNIKLNQISDVDKSSLLKRFYGGSLPKALVSVYPNHDWKLWKFPLKRVWHDPKSQREYFDEIATKLNIKDNSDWYNVQKSEVLKLGAGRILYHYNESLPNALQALYPDYNWEMWRFGKVPNNLWNDLTQVRAKLTSLGKELGVNSLDDWYKITGKDLINNNASGLLHHFQYSIYKLLSTAFPEKQWHPWLFESAPQRWWKSKENQRIYLDWAAEQLGLKDLQDWYNVPVSALLKLKGFSSLRTNTKGLANALISCYPEHDWEVWRLAGHINSETTLTQSTLRKLEEYLQLKSKDDWYRVSMETLHTLGASKLMRAYRGLYNFLVKHYPEHNWDQKQLRSSSKKASQFLLKSLLGEIFPNQEILEEFSHANLQFSSNEPMELDVYIPNLKLAFEYHGKHHYVDTPYFGPTSKYKERDAEKRMKCLESGITLVEVPYHWDKTKASLISLIPEHFSKMSTQ